MQPKKKKKNYPGVKFWLDEAHSLTDSSEGAHINSIPIQTIFFQFYWCNRHIKLYEYEVHNILIQVYIADDGHSKFSLSTHIVKKMFFLAMRTFKMYCLSKFQKCNIVLLTVVTMWYIIFPELICLITGSLYLLTTFTQPPPSHRPLATTSLFSVSVSSFF